MIFNSFEFVLFFVLFLTAFFATPQRWRGLVVLVSSYIFYGAYKPAYCLLLLSPPCWIMPRAARWMRFPPTGRGGWS